MNGVSEKLLANVEYFQSELSAEMKDRSSFKDQLKAAFSSQSIGAKFDAILRCEIKRRSAVIQSRKITLQVRSGSVCLQGSRVNPVLNSPVHSRWSICCIQGLSRALNMVPHREHLHTCHCHRCRSRYPRDLELVGSQVVFWK